jgi:DNA (cytosine-5)-methyltransferase 1
MHVLDDTDFLHLFDVIHASPPCQQYTRATSLRDAQGGTPTTPDLLEPVRDALRNTGIPYIIENVPGAPLQEPIMLCGSMFGLSARRHRLFESSLPLGNQPSCDHATQGRPIGVYGTPGDVIPDGGRTAATVGEAQDALGITWMKWNDLIEAIPPAYTHLIGQRVLTHLAATP